MAERADRVAALKPQESTAGAESRGGTTASPTGGGPAARRPRRRRGTGMVISLLVIAVAGYFGVREFKARLTHVFEQDARIAGNLITISSRVSGWITALDVREGQTVSKGAVLAV